MRIYIDESGPFLPLAGSKRRYSCLGALAIRDAQHDDVETEFRRLRRQIGGSDSEIKGSSLTERQAARVVGMLREFDVVLDVCATDMGAYSDVDVSRVKERQAQILDNSVGEEHHPTMIAQVRDLAATTRRLSNQLFVQAFMTTLLIERAVEVFTLHYVQRAPKELGSFTWIVDAKAKELTPSEYLWSHLIFPVIQSRSRRYPMVMLEGADYGYFGQFTAPLTVDDGDVAADGTDLGKLLRNLSFRDSRDQIGLQLVDLLSSICARALNGALREEGWSKLGTIMVGRKGSTVRFVRMSISADESSSELLRDPLAQSVVRVLERHSLPIVSDDLKRRHPQKRTDA